MAAVGEPLTAPAPTRNLLARLALIVTSPQTAYTEIAARPTALGALAVVVAVMMLCQFIFLSTDVGRGVMLEQQLSTMESFGVNVTPEMEQQMRQSAGSGRYTGPASQLIFVPLMTAVIAAILLALFNVTSDRSSTFKHVFSVVAHSGIIIAIQQIVMTPISYALGEFATVTRITVFLPFLDPDGFVSHLLEPIELFALWWLVNLSIGLGVLYRRTTGSAAMVVGSVYAVIGIAIAVIRAAF